MLEVRNLTKRYRRTPVVDNVSFDLAPGIVTGYLGPNGSGKSTTVKMLAGLVEPTSGQIRYDGNDIRRDPIAFKRRIGYVPEEALVYPTLSAQEYLELTGRVRGMPEALIAERAGSLLSLFGLHYRRHSPLGAYSKGMKQRVLIAAALLHDPEFLILDEPLAGMDVSSALLFRHLMTELARRGKIILYISHILEVVEKISSKVIVLYKGRVVAEGDVAELRRLMELPTLEAIFAQLVEHDDLEGIAREIAEAVVSCPTGAGR